MADKAIKAKELKKQLQISNATIAKLRASNTMPKIDGEMLVLLINTLRCDITDLIEAVYEDAEDNT